MENTTQAVEHLFEKAKTYTQTSIELLKLNIIDKASEIISDLSVKILVSVVVIVALTYTNIALALYLGELLGKNYLGFFAISGFYLLVAIIIFLFKEKIVRNPIRQFVINQFLN